MQSEIVDSYKGQYYINPARSLNWTTVIPLTKSQ